MKTFKKALIGMLILAPLFLPTSTKAGGFDDWLHGLFHQPRENSFGRPGEGRAPVNSYRPYDPRFQGRQVPGCPPGRSGAGNAVPIDGGIIFLLLAGLAFGGKKMYDLRKREVAPATN